MQPKSYLNFLSKNWAFVTELFEISRGIPIDYVGLTQTIRAFYPYIELHPFIKRLEEYEIIEKDLSYESVYSLSDKTDQIVELILNEQQLGLSDSIRVYIEQFDKLSLGLLKAVQNKNLDEIVRFFKKIKRQIQSVMRQGSYNYKGIENLVAHSKKQDSIVPLKQRYADVINAWEDYIIPMGKFIKSNDSFDATVDKAITRLNAAITFLEDSSSMSSERQNIRTSKRKFEDMRGYLINTFGFSKALLEPFYKTARLNSKVTKGVSTKGNIIYYGGWVSNRVIEWLKKQEKPPHIIFPDYDIVGLTNYLKLKEEFPNIKLYVPNNLPDLLKRFGNAEKLNTKASRRLIETTQDKDARRVYSLILEYGVGIDQESLMLQ